MRMNKDTPVGIYVVETLGILEYYKQLSTSESLRSFHKSADEIFEVNKEFCSKTYLILRRTWKPHEDSLINVIILNSQGDKSILPNGVIKTTYNEEQGKIKYPELFI